jgi:hypothetical protein
VHKVALIVLLGLGGCVVVTDHHGVGGGIPSGAPVSLIQNGAGIPISPGAMAGYGITSNTGTSFRIVWTGDAGAVGGYREFWGSVWTPGVFDSVTPGCFQNACPLESDDFLSSPISLSSGGERIDWDTFATTGLDGFDFTATGEPIYFDMFIDGVRYPALTVFTDGSTGQLASAPGLPFGLQTR